MIPNSVDLERLRLVPGLREKSRRALRIDPDVTVVLAIGRLDRQKGFDVLLRAAALLRQDVKSLIVVILGEGPERALLASLAAELGLDEVVRLPGATLDIAEHFAAADVFAFPSRFEGFGMALAEAMVASMPCVTTDVPPVLEFARHEETALVVPVGAADALAAQVLRLVENPDLAEGLGVRARSLATARFDVRVTTPQWHAVYEEELASHA